MNLFLKAFNQNVLVGTICAFVYSLIWFFFVSDFAFLESFFLGFMSSSTMITWIESIPDEERAKRVMKRYVIIVIAILVLLTGVLIIL